MQEALYKECSLLDVKLSMLLALKQEHLAQVSAKLTEGLIRDKALPAPLVSKREQAP